VYLIPFDTPMAYLGVVHLTNIHLTTTVKAQIFQHSDLKLNALCQRQFISPVNGIGLPAHIGFPGIRA